MIHIKLSMNRISIGIATFAVAMIAAGCSGSSSDAVGGNPLPTAQVNLPAQSTIVGTFNEVGGPTPGKPRPLSGTITVIEVDTNSIAATTHAKANGSFTVPVPPGTYSVYGQSRHYANGKAKCPGSHHITLANGKTAIVAVACQLK